MRSLEFFKTLFHVSINFCVRPRLLLYFHLLITLKFLQKKLRLRENSNFILYNVFLYKLLYVTYLIIISLLRSNLYEDSVFTVSITIKFLYFKLGAAINDHILFFILLLKLKRRINDIGSNNPCVQKQWKL